MRLTVLFLVACFSASAFAQQFATSFKAGEVSPGIWMIEGEGGFGGGNMGLLPGDEFTVLIDDGITPLAPMLEEKIQAVAGRPVNFIVNTHVHGDHVGGNTHFAETGAVIFAHENIRRRLLEDATEAGGLRGLPVVTFGDGVSFYVNGLEARAFHLPAAHTDGDSAIFLPGRNVLFAGDAQFHHLFPFIDLDNGGSYAGYVAAQERLLQIADDQTRIVPGHGALNDRAGLAEDLRVLRDCHARVAALVAQGLTADEVVAKNPLAPYHDGYNWSFITTERMTRTLVRVINGGASS